MPILNHGDFEEVEVILNHTSDTSADINSCLVTQPHSVSSTNSPLQHLSLSITSGASAVFLIIRALLDESRAEESCSTLGSHV